jgi:hypothetical protein
LGLSFNAIANNHSVTINEHVGLPPMSVPACDASVPSAGATENYLRLPPSTECVKGEFLMNCVFHN